MLSRVLAQKERPQPEVFKEYLWTPEKYPTGISSVFFLRAETNGGPREQKLGQLLKQFGGSTIYVANLNAEFNLSRKVYVQHSNIRYTFACAASSLLKHYPEIMQELQRHFGADFLHGKKIIGSYEALPILEKVYPDYSDFITELTPRERADFIFYYKLSTQSLHIYGQTIVPYGNYLIFNPTLPHLVATTDHGTEGLITNHELPNTDKHFFVAGIHVDSEKTLLLLREKITEVYHHHDLLLSSDYNKQIHYQMETYHLSLGYIEGMFDTMDFLFSEQGKTPLYTETPLGIKLHEKGITPEDIQNLRDNPLFRTGNPQKLFHIIEDNKGMSLDESVTFFLAAVAYKKDHPLE